MRTEVVEARTAHCKMLARAMDEEGREFIRRHWGIEPLDGLLEALDNSPLCWSIFVDGRIAGMFGCNEDGQAWLTTAPDIERAKLRFIRQSRPYVEKMKERYGSLFSYAHKDNAPLLAWLEWAGFERVSRMGEFEICVCR